MGAPTTGRPAPRKRYDKELVRERTLELLSIRLGPGKDQGARLVWACPECGKHEKYSVVKGTKTGGCLVADCRLAGSDDVFAMLAGLEGLDSQVDFLALLEKSYELLGLEPATGGSASRKTSSAGKQNGSPGIKTGKDSPGPPRKASPHSVPVSPKHQSPAQPNIANGDTPQDLEALLTLAAEVYERILEMCPLESRDRKYLREERGISNDTIRQARFGTMTHPRANKAKAELEREFGREKLLLIPGFSVDEKTGRLKFTLTGSYILIPYHDTKGRITTIEGRCVGEPPEGMGKYVSLRGAGNHLYIFPGYEPEDFQAVTEGVIGAVVAADSGLAVGSIMGCERFKASPSAEMLDGEPGDPLLELAGTDFGGRTLPYIPDADDPPNPNVLRALPKAARWLAEPQNGRAAICLLPKGADLDEWLLSIEPTERPAKFAELLAGAQPPEDGRPLAQTQTGEQGPQEGVVSGHSTEATGPSTSPTPPEASNGAVPGENNGKVFTAEDVSRAGGKVSEPTGKKSSTAKGSATKSKEKAKSKSESPKPASETREKEEVPQPGLWEEAELAGGDGTEDGENKSTEKGLSGGARKVRDEVYQAVIESLPPKEAHVRTLEKKGVIPEAASYGRFASLDRKRVKKLVPELVERFGAKRLLSVPGFELDGLGKVRLSMANAGAAGDASGEYLLLPCFDAKGLLVGLEGLAYDPKNRELAVEETVPLKGAGSHLYVFAAFGPRRLEGFCEGPLGALLAAQEDVVVGAIGGFRRYKAASGPGEGRQPVQAVLPELEGVDFAGREISYVPRAGAGLGEPNARYHEAEAAARWLVGRQNGSPAVVGLDDGVEPPAKKDETSGVDRSPENSAVPDTPTSLGDWLLTLDEDEVEPNLRKLFPEVTEGTTGKDKTSGGDDHRTTEESDSEAEGSSAKDPAEGTAPPLPSTLVYGTVGATAVVGAGLDALVLRLRDFAGYVSVGSGGEQVLYAGALGPLREFADSAPFHLLYDWHAPVAFAAALVLALVLLTKAGESHRAKWKAAHLRLEEHWNLHLTPVRRPVPSAAVLTLGELLWAILAWPLAYLISSWLIWAAVAGLSLAVRLQMAPEIDLGILADNPTQVALYTATAISLFVLWQRRTIRTSEARMLQGKIGH